jgi:DNA-binding HxlR family transcriptional regulator
VRSYRQYCAVAKALDVVGDRWNLLIVRELVLRGACRYVDLLKGLPGIATNLLAERLHDLEAAGVVYRDDAPPPIATTLFRLTERGEQLKPVVVELARWGAPLMSQRGEDETFRGYWVAVVAQLFPTDHSPGGPAATIELRADDEPTTIEVAHGAVQAHPGPAARPDLILSGPGQLILGVVMGRLAINDALARGLRYAGDLEVLLRLRPNAPAEGESPTPAAGTQRERSRAA